MCLFKAKPRDSLYFFIPLDIGQQAGFGRGGDSAPLALALSDDCQQGSYSVQVSAGPGAYGNFGFANQGLQFSSAAYRYIHLWVKPLTAESWLTFHVWDVDHASLGGWKTLKGDKDGDMWFRTGQDMAVNQWNELWLDLNKNDQGWVNSTVTSFSVHASNNSTFLFDDVYCNPGAYNTYHYFCDYLGSPRVMTNNSGQVTWRQDYYAFGSDYNGSATGNTHKFTGHMQDAATGQYYAKARYFTTQLGRWSQPEPLLNGVPPKWYKYLPQLFNHYTYSLNNPLRIIDPDGNQVFDKAEDIMSIGEKNLNADDLQPIFDDEGNLISSYCNMNIQQIAAAGGNVDYTGMNANRIVQKLSNILYATELTEEEAVSYAKAGALVIAGILGDNLGTDKETSGHVAFVSPEDMQESGTYGGRKVPVIYNVGKSMIHGSVAQGFGKVRPKYYIRNVDKAQVNINSAKQNEKKGTYFGVKVAYRNMLTDDLFPKP